MLLVDNFQQLYGDLNLLLAISVILWKLLIAALAIERSSGWLIYPSLEIIFSLFAELISIEVKLKSELDFCSYFCVRSPLFTFLIFL